MCAPVYRYVVVVRVNPLSDSHPFRWRDNLSLTEFGSESQFAGRIGTIHYGY
jgi:hypothetical protein